MWLRGAVRGAVLASVLLAGVACSEDGPAPGEQTGLRGDQGSPGPEASALQKMAEEEARRNLPQNSPSVEPRVRAPRYGADISWPNCAKGVGIPEKQGQGLPMPLASAGFVIVGLTNSPSFTQNPCLADQLEWLRERRLLAAAYSVVSYPDDEELDTYRDSGPYDGDTELGALRNVGYAAAAFNLDTMQELDFPSPIVWIDVEPVPSFEWSDDPQANAAVVEGTVRGYRDAGVRVGFYSVQSLWTDIVGDLAFDGVPEWRAAGETSEAEARSRCAASWAFQGGDAVFGQWIDGSRDRNLTCPGVDLTAGGGLSRWFTRM